MHIHGNPMQFSAMNLQQTNGAEKAAAQQQAAETRRKLLQGNFEFEGEVDPEMALMVESWSEQDDQPQQGRQQKMYQKQTGTPARERLEEVEQADQPVSVWA